MVSFPFGKTVVLQTRTVTGKDSYGNDVYGVKPYAVSGVAVWPTVSSESTQGIDQVSDTQSALLPPGVAISAIDAVQIDGDTYEVVGEPQQYSSPLTGTQPGIVVQLRQVTG